MKSREGPRAAHSPSFVFIVAVGLAAAGMAAAALILRTSGASLAAAILGLYVLHLLSIRYILLAQRQQQEALAEQFEQLRQLLGGVPAHDAEPAEPPGPAGAANAAAARGANGTAGGATNAAEAAAAHGAGARAAHRGGAGAANGAPTPAPAELTVELPLPRHLALGTVAIIRDALTPEDVARVLVEQERRPGTRFGDAAVALGLLTPAGLEELLETQGRGLFTPEEIARARERIEEFRRERAPAAT